MSKYFTLMRRSEQWIINIITEEEMEKGKYE
jgi:hypothetical protein